jgi:hypothetical protein
MVKSLPRKPERLLARFFLKPGRLPSARVFFSGEEVPNDAPGN